MGKTYPSLNELKEGLFLDGVEGLSEVEILVLLKRLDELFSLPKLAIQDELPEEADLLAVLVKVDVGLLLEGQIGLYVLLFL